MRGSSAGSRACQKHVTAPHCKRCQRDRCPLCAARARTYLNVTHGCDGPAKENDTRARRLLGGVRTSVCKGVNCVHLLPGKKEQRA